MTEPLRASPPERYEEISQHLLEQARQELENGDILQASEKVWGATAHYIKAVAQERGWNHHAHDYLRDVALYIGLAHDRQDFRQLFGYLEAFHRNYYEHQREMSDVRDAVEGAEVFVSEMSRLRGQGSPEQQDHLSPSELADQERRLRRLTTKTRYSHGDAYGEDELDKLPPVRPAPTP